MPYITQTRRKEIQEGSTPKCKGDLNYICYAFGLEYIKEHGNSYQNISDAVDALRGAAEELKRRVQDPYEDKKIKENGDIE